MVMGIFTMLLGAACLITALIYPSHLLSIVYSSVASVFLCLVCEKNKNKINYIGNRDFNYISQMMAYDTQMIFGGRHNDLGEDEYIYGAVSLYTDFMQLFLHMLNLVNECL